MPYVVHWNQHRLRVKQLSGVEVQSVPKANEHMGTFPNIPQNVPP